MSNAKQPPLMDSPEAREIFASEVVGTGRIGNSVAVSLATHRWVVPEFGDDLKLARVVVARLMLSNDAALQLARRLTALAQSDGARPAAPAAQGQPAPGKTITGRLPVSVLRPAPVATMHERSLGKGVPAQAKPAAETVRKPDSAGKRKSSAKGARKSARKAR
ncbi:MAG: hypothetical protein AB7G34_10095 [Hyphomicrobiales bacterium]